MAASKIVETFSLAPSSYLCFPNGYESSPELFFAADGNDAIWHAATHWPTAKPHGVWLRVGRT